MTAKIKLNAASGGGSVSIQAPSSSSNNRVHSLPDVADGTVLTTTNPKAGNIIQVVIEPKRTTSSQAVNGATYDYSSGLTNDFISCNITPTSASNKILIRASIIVGCSDDKQVFAHLYKAGSPINDARGDTSDQQRISAGVYIEDPHKIAMLTHEYLDTAGGTSAITYSYRFSHGSSSQKTIYVNRSHTESATMSYSRGYSSLILMEVAA